MVDFADQLRLDGQLQSRGQPPTLFGMKQDMGCRDVDSRSVPAQSGWANPALFQSGLGQTPGISHFHPYLVQPHQLVSVDQHSFQDSKKLSCTSQVPAPAPAAASSGSNSENEMLLSYMRGLHQMLLAQQAQLGIALQMQMQHHRQTPIIIQNTTQVGAESHIEAGPTQSASHFQLPTWLRRFWASPANKVILLSTVVLVGYMIRENWLRSWKAEQWQRRVDSNLFLKGVQLLERSFGLNRFS